MRKLGLYMILFSAIGMLLLFGFDFCLKILNQKDHILPHESLFYVYDIVFLINAVVILTLAIFELKRKETRE